MNSVYDVVKQPPHICRRVLFALLMPLLFVVGCGNDRPQTVNVNGTVTFNGAPVGNVNVTFASDSGRPASGITDAEGRFVLSTFDPQDGALPGEYKVLITTAWTGDSDMVFPPKPDYLKKTSELGFPRKYANPTQTDLNFQVKPGETNTFAIELTE